MPGELTDADHRVDLRSGHSRIRRAAYVTTEDKQLPGMLVLKDRNHQVVAAFSKDDVLAVERLEQGAADTRTEITEGGFEPTSQAMKRAGIKPEDVLADPA